MIRRFVSILLTIGVCVSHLADTPHVHAGFSEEQRRAHDATPHIHCHSHSGHSRSGHSHSGHSHSGHSHSGHSHSGHGHSQAGRYQPIASAVASQGGDHEVRLDRLVVSVHDATACFFPAWESCVAVCPRQLVETAVEAGPTSFANCPPLFGLVRCRGGGAEYRPPPPNTRGGSNTYLTLRNLRI
jgi:hypothetical protein